MDDRVLLDFYGINSLFPTEWPKDKDRDEDDEHEGEAEDDMAAKRNRRKSRYQVLEKPQASRHPPLPSSRPTSSQTNSIVQRDEPDPLGSTDSVVRALQRMGLPADEDANLRNQFMLSSTSFSPPLFLSQIHGQDDTDTLLRGLDVLGSSIDMKSASLKILVETNFERFVKAKATIDNVYREMKYRGADPQAITGNQPPSRLRGHIRHSSRSAFRNSAVGGAASVDESLKKNALLKESEYGILGIKGPLLDVAAKAEDVWGPALGGQEKQAVLKAILSHLEYYKEYVELSSVISDSIRRKDHEALVDEFNKARRFAQTSRENISQLQGTPPSDADLYQVLIASRMWHDVHEQIQVFKRGILRKLTQAATSSSAKSLVASAHAKGALASKGSPQFAGESPLDMIALLLELGVQENPISLWLTSQLEALTDRVTFGVERIRIEIEAYRRQLASFEPPKQGTLTQYLRFLASQNSSALSKPSLLDSAVVIEVWERMAAFLTELLSPSSQCILGEVLDFAATLQGFVTGKTQTSLPIGFNGESRRHHQLDPEIIVKLENGVCELVDAIRNHVSAFFAGTPPEDISILFSPLAPESPRTPAGLASPYSPTPSVLLTPASAGALSPRDRRLIFDPKKPPPPPSQKRSELWEKFAFLPPWSNSLSGVYYLSKFLSMVASSVADMASLGVVRQQSDSAVFERLKLLVTVSRERTVTALCALWNKDAENIKFVEDWQRSSDGADVTRMPSTFSTFEGALLGGMQRILYISDAMPHSGVGDIVQPPPTKLLQMVRSQYVTTLYKALSGMVENAEKSVQLAKDEWTADITASASSSSIAFQGVLSENGLLDSSDRNIRMLLTLSNLQALRSVIVPNLNGQFENAFSVKLTEESKTIKDVLGQIDARLFQSYTRPSVELLRKMVVEGLSAADWAPPPSTKPKEAKNYVYDVLLHLVLVHSQVSTTAPSLTTQIISFLLEQLTRQLLEVLQQRPRYSLEVLMQATLDVEFIAQTLSQYTTTRASELQSQIYQELDSRTDHEARGRLQKELPEMRSVLKKLRDSSKNEFACFRKPKRAP